MHASSLLLHNPLSQERSFSPKMIKLTLVFILSTFISLVLYVINNSPAALLTDIIGPVEFALMVIQIIWEMLLTRTCII
ncbi:hypothetical protein KCU83_g4862, partial [Aureobasidium melanogenum]